MIRTLTPARIALLVLSLAAIGSEALAQHDSRGRVFWVTFMPNLGTGSQPSDMRLYVAADTPSVAHVMYFVTGETIDVPIPMANTTVEIDIRKMFGSGVELDMWEEFSSKSILVSSDHDITCYGVSIRSKSADAWMSLPDDVLTNTYVVLAYPNGFSDFGQGFEEYDTPSQFAIVATEDGTTVRIDPACELQGRLRQMFTITLDRGEVFNGQARVGIYQDVSGTEIRSNKPVAVYAGNQRAAVPLSVGNYRDHMAEQMPPLEVWGKDAIVTPHFPITEQSSDTAVIRIISATDRTAWTINGVPQPPLMRMQPQERPLLESMYISSTEPILVAQYEHSVNADDDNSDPLPGDPFMMIVPPTEQFHTHYSFQAISHSEFASFGHFVNVVIPTVAIGSVLLDGAPVDAIWLATPKPGFSYAQVQIDPGSHFIIADSAFGIYSYGFGPANSYGYPGGQLFRLLVHDHNGPDIQQDVICDGAEGYAFDSRLTDSGIDSLYVLPTSRNVNVTIEPFAPGADTVRYHARLVDPYSDGLVSMKAIDSTGRSRTQTNPVRGFTVRGRGMPGMNRLLLDTLRLFNRGSGCVPMVIENNGAFEQTIVRIGFDPELPAVTTDAVFPLRLAPGQQATINFCATGLPDTLLTANVLLFNECIDRAVAIIPIESGTDTTSPSITSSDVTCNRDILLTLSDIVGTYSRIESIEFEELINAREIERTADGSAMPSTRVAIRLAAIDEFRDVIYQIRVTDVAGNATVFRDTIGGFTVTALDDGRDSVSQRFGRELGIAGFAPGTERCDSVLFVNYGARPVTLGRIWFSGNRQYSLPPAQLPFTIAPGAERKLQVCIEQGATGLSNDTLHLVDACGRHDALVIAANVGVLSGQDACDNSLTVTSLGAAKRTFLATPHPNPANGSTAAVDVGLHADALVVLEIMDGNGRAASTVLQNVGMPAGLHRVVFDVSTLGSGTYYCRLRTSAGALLVEKLVITR